MKNVFTFFYCKVHLIYPKREANEYVYQIDSLIGNYAIVNAHLTQNRT